VELQTAFITVLNYCLTDAIAAISSSLSIEIILVDISTKYSFYTADMSSYRVLPLHDRYTDRERGGREGEL
jgi:hypothetical protein